jgi:hypothetical protein
MRTAIRKPKLNKPDRGMKMFLKQKRKSLSNAAAKFTRKLATPKQKWLSSKAVRAKWLLSHRSSSYMPHQGPQECDRRVRQMAKAHAAD